MIASYNENAWNLWWMTTLEWWFLMKRMVQDAELPCYSRTCKGVESGVTVHCVLVCIGHRDTARWPADAIGSALCRHSDALDRCTQLNRTPPNITSPGWRSCLDEQIACTTV